MKTLAEIQDFFKNDLFAMENGVKITEVGEGYGICELTLTPHHKNARGVPQGGVLFTLGDLAFAVAAAANEAPAVTVTSEIHFLAPAKGEKLTARAERIRDGKTAVHYRVRVKDDTGRDVAELLICGFRITL